MESFQDDLDAGLAAARLWTPPDVGGIADVRHQSQMFASINPKIPATYTSASSLS